MNAPVERDHFKKAPHKVINQMKDRKKKQTYSIGRTHPFAHLLDFYWDTTDDVYYFQLSDSIEKWVDHLLETWGSPSAWYLNSRKFRKAARILHSQTIGIKGKHNNLEPDEDDLAPYYSIDEIIISLMGVAIENLFKGILTAKGAQYKDLVKDGHDIKKLYRRCEKLYSEESISEFSIEQAHYMLLDALTPYLKWAGRYTRPHRIELVRLLVDKSYFSDHKELIRELEDPDSWLGPWKLPDHTSLKDAARSAYVLIQRTISYRRCRREPTQIHDPIHVCTITRRDGLKTYYMRCRPLYL